MKYLTDSDSEPRRQTPAMLQRRVDELQTANQALTRQKNRLERIIQTAPTGIGMVSNRILLQVNDRICEITGYTRDELVGQSARILYPTEEDFDHVGSAIYAQIREHDTGTVETRWQRKDGAIIEVLLSSTPVAPDDLAAGVTFTAIDITERKRTEGARARRARELTALYETSLEITAQRDLSTLLRAIVERATNLLNTRMGGLYLVDDSNEALELVVSHNLPGDYVGNRLEFGQGVAGRVAQTGEPLIVEDYRNWEGRAKAYNDKSFCRVLGVPLKAGDRLIGVLTVTDEEQAYSFTEDEVQLAQMFADQAAIAVNNARLYETSQHELTERLRAQEALRKSEEKFSKAFHASPVAISLVRFSDGCYVDANESHWQITGYRREEVVGHTTLEISIWDDPEDDARASSLLNTEGSIRNREFRFRKKSGELVIARLSSELIDIDGETYVLNVAEDITQQKATEAALRESEQLYRSLIDVVPEGVALSDLSGNIRFVSPQLLSIYGSASVESAIGTNALRWIAPESRGKALANIQNLAKNEIAADSEYVLLKEDGTRFYGEITGAVLTDDEGIPTGLVTVHRDITERIEMQNALRANEERYRRLAENGPDIIFRYELSPQPHLEYVNQAVEKITGYTPEECYADPMLMINMAHPDDAHIMANLMQTLGPLDNPIVMRWVGKDGAVRWMESRLVPVYDDAGQMIEVEGITRDITARRDVEQVLREERDRAQSYLDIADVMLLTLDRRGEITMLNRKGYKLLEYPEGSLLGKNWFDTCRPPREREKAKADFARTMAGDDNYIEYYENTVHTHTGKERIVVWHNTVLRDEDGTIAGTLSSAEDITELKQAELERERLFAQLQESALQIRQIVETVPEGVILLDAYLSVLLCNPVARDYLTVLTDLTNECRGNTLTHLSGQPLTRFLDRPSNDLWHTVTADHRTFQVTARAVENSPAIDGWVLVIRDVTREHEIQQRVQRQERLAAIGQLAAGIAHDFNNIISVIVLYSQMSTRIANLPTPVVERLGVIADQGQQAAELITQILDFSRSTILDRRPLDLVPLIKEQTKLWQRTMPDNVRVELTFTDAVCSVNADPTRIRQALMNLVVNARDAMPNGGRLHIDLARIRIPDRDTMPSPDLHPGDWVRITVSDTGTGIPNKLIAHIFDPFFTTKSPGKGTGLGLAQVYGIVVQHDGVIDVETQVGHGTSMIVYLPALPAPERAVPTTAASDIPMGTDQTILVVEDSPPTRTVIVETLDALNYTVLEAGNGKHALDILAARGDDVALILSDMVMPEMGGMDMARELHRQASPIPIVLMSGHPLNEDISDINKVGIVEWIQKPPSLAQLADVLSREIEARDPNAGSQH